MERPILMFIFGLQLCGYGVARPTRPPELTSRHHLLRDKSLIDPSVFRWKREKNHQSTTSPIQNDIVRFLLDHRDLVSAVLQVIELTLKYRNDRLCERTALSDMKYSPIPQSYSRFDPQTKAALKTANILNNLFLKASNETDVLSELFYYSLVKANVESEPVIVSSSVAFQREDYHLADPQERSLFIPHAFRQDGFVGTKDLGKFVSADRWGGNDWFWKQATKNYTDIFTKKFGTDYSSVVGAVVNGSADLLVSGEDGWWTPPYFDCGPGRSWAITYSTPFFSHHGNDLLFRGAVGITISLQNFDINQCAKDNSMFAGTHKCDVITTECVHIPGLGFRRGSYRCHCKLGYYYPNDAVGSGMNYFTGAEVEEAYILTVMKSSVLVGSSVYPDDFRCLPCRPGCTTCLGDSPCFVEYSMLLRSLILGFQSFCTTIVIILGIVVFRLRKSKMFASAMWVMLETILFGALLIYQTIIIRYFEPSTLTCMLEPWFRELGFAICYGAIILKIYRILAEFQTRKAHRVCVRDKDLLKYLFGIILVIVGYLSAWTAVIMDNITGGYSIVVHGKTAKGLKYIICRALWWDYVTEIGEILFLLLGVFLTYRVRNAKSDCFKEKASLSWAVYFEALVSLLMYTIRHVVWQNIEPDYIYLLYFLRCQFTITIVLFLVFGPKLWYHHRPPDPLEYQQGRHLSSCEVQDQIPETMKLHDAITSNGEVDFSEINLSDMDPEDIRAELRRVYTQLQILRNITMRKGNPHISRRRGGRKGTHRRFSLQTFHHRHKHYHEHEHDGTEVSKTPEESTASVEGAQTEGTRTDEATSTPTVTFQEGLK